MVFITHFFFFFPPNLCKKRGFSKDPFEYRNINSPKGVSEMPKAPATGTNNHNLLLPFSLQMLFSYINKYCNSFTNHWGHLLIHTPLNLQTVPAMEAEAEWRKHHQTTKKARAEAILFPASPSKPSALIWIWKLFRRKHFSSLTGWKVFCEIHDFLGDKTLLRCFWRVD